MLKPLSKNVVLKKEEEQTKTESGIILTTESKSLPSIAKVLAVGPKCESGLKAGDHVVFKEYSGTKVKMKAEEYIVIEEDDILACLDEEE